MATAAQRPRLSKDRLLRAAVRRADREGIDSLSMRTLAVDLGAKPMSLYFYVASKEDILGGILDLIVSEFELSEEADWRSALRRSMLSAHDTLLRHPWACQLFMTTPRSSARLRYMEALLKTLREGGFSPLMTHHAYHVLESHLIGFTLWETGHTEDRGLTNRAKAFVGGKAAAAYPYVVEHARLHFGASARRDRPEFEFGLDLLLEALESRRTDSSEGTPSTRRARE